MSSIIPSLTVSQIRAMSVARIIALTPDDVAALSTNQIKAFSWTQIAAFEQEDFEAFSAEQLSALSANAMKGLTLDHQAESKGRAGGMVLPARVRAGRRPGGQPRRARKASMRVANNASVSIICSARFRLWITVE